jgi:hypothetical protein
VPKLRLLGGRDRAGRDVATVRVITYAPTVFTHCQHCEVAFGEIGLGERIRREEAASALPEDLALDFAKLSDWVRSLMERHGPRIHLEVMDAASVEGVIASLRHRLWRHPAVVVDGESVHIDGDYAVAEPAIERAIARHPAPAPAPTPAEGRDARVSSG